MAICMKCGAVINEEDAKNNKHKCDLTLIPEKGFEKKPLSVEVEVAKDV